MGQQVLKNPVAVAKSCSGFPVARVAAHIGNAQAAIRGQLLKKPVQQVGFGLADRLSWRVWLLAQGENGAVQ